MNALQRALKVLKKGRYTPVEFGMEMWPGHAELWSTGLMDKRARVFLSELHKRDLIRKDGTEYYAL